MQLHVSLFILDLCLSTAQAEKRHGYPNVIVYEKLCFHVFRPHTPKSKASIFRFLLFEERFRKGLFSWRISVKGRPNCRKKTRLSCYFVNDA